MKTLLALLAVVLLAGCAESTAPEIETSIFFLARQKNGQKINCTFYIFEQNTYDPTSFDGTLNISEGWSSGKLKTTSGETVRSFFINIVSQNDAVYGSYQLSPGNYYIVASYSGLSGTTWMAKPILVIKNKATVIEPVFENLYAVGYVEWNE